MRYLIIIFLWLSQASSSPLCTGVFNPLITLQSTEVFTSQDYLGHHWSRSKLEELNFEYEIWNWVNLRRSQQNFITDITLKKSPPGYRDTDGNFRVFDNNHKLLSFYDFMAPEAFSLTGRLAKDYTQVNPATSQRWTPQEMMNDLISKGWVSFRHTNKPTIEDLRALPRIYELPDSPERSVFSYVFRSFDTPLKGSDFEPMIQIHLAQEMRRLGIEPVTANPYSKANIDRLRFVIINSNSLLDFLISDLKPNHMKPVRLPRVRLFLNGLRQ